MFICSCAYPSDDNYKERGGEEGNISATYILPYLVSCHI